ncbi:MAG: PD-(D/E)XK nuclease family protein [Acidimicrobiia bacterium]
MPVQVEWVAYGDESYAALRRALATAKAGDPLAPVTVVVPSHQVGVTARRRSARDPASGPAGIAAVSFATVGGLAGGLAGAALAATGRRPVTGALVAASVRAALGAGPGVFAGVADHPSTVAALVAAHRELRACTPEALDHLARTSRRAHDVVGLHRRARAALAPLAFDQQDLVDAATAEARGAGGALPSIGRLVAFLPQRLDEGAAGLLTALAGSAPLVVIAASTGDDAADAEVVEAVRRLGGADRPRPAVGLPVAPGRTRLVTVSDPDEEARAAVRAVLDAVRAGASLGRVALLHPGDEPYPRLVREHLTAAAIPFRGADGGPLATSVAGRTLLGLMALPRHGFRRDEVMAWLAGAPLLDGGRPVPAGTWERVSRRAGVVAGRQQWDERLAGLARRLDPAGAGSGAASEGRGAAQVLALRRFVTSLADELAERAATPRPWSDHAAWSRLLLERLLGNAGERAGWPADELAAHAQVVAVLDELSALDALEGPVGLDQVADALRAELEVQARRTTARGPGVIVGPIAIGPGLDVDLLVVLGLAEGTLPAPAGDDSLLPDREREATGGQLALRAGRVERDHRALVAALAGAAHQVLLVPRGDLRRSTARVPSRWALDVAAVLEGSPHRSGHELLEDPAPWATHVASFDAGLRHGPRPATAQEHRLVALLAQGEPHPLRVHPATAGAVDAATAQGAAVVVARRGASFTRFDGNVAGAALGSPVATVATPTQLERWASCPFAYFVHDVLGVRPVDDPEDLVRVTPLDWGDLVHQTLEAFLLEALSEGRAPAAGAAWTADDRIRLRATGQARCDALEASGRTGRPLFWHADRARFLRELDRFLDADDRRRAEHRLSPLAAELAFGDDGSPVSLALDDGRRLHLRGRADRLDRAPDGALHVLDYKTGSPRPYEGISAEDPDLRGTRLQLAVYGLAARARHGHDATPVRAEYWFTSARGGYARTGYDVTDEVVARVTASVSTIVAGIEAGAFPARPTATSTSPWVECPACDPDGLGTADLRRAWDAKRSAPELRRYVALAEPADPPGPAHDERTADDG